jgi:hypothetical protein
MSNTSSVSVRGIDLNLWWQLRGRALAEGKPVGQLLNQIIRDWLAAQR